MSLRSSSPVVFLLLLMIPCAAPAGAKVSIHGIYMVPYGNDAKEVSRPGWGLGGNFIVGLPNASDIINGHFGLEYINLLSNSVDGVAEVEGIVLPYSKSTDQWYGRILLGGQVGGLGRGFFRPYIGLNAALVLYAINTDLNFKPGTEDEFTEHKYDDIDAVFGYDITVGADLNVSDQISLDGGFKYLKSFSVPDQLGGGSVKIYPQYYQIYLGIGIAIFAKEFE